MEQSFPRTPPPFPRPAMTPEACALVAAVRAVATQPDLLDDAGLPSCTDLGFCSGLTEVTPDARQIALETQRYFPEDPTPWEAPRSFEEQTVAVIASGPSLTSDQVAACIAAGVRTIAVKHALDLCQGADVLYGCEGQSYRFWLNIGASAHWFRGMKVSGQSLAAIASGVRWLPGKANPALSADPSWLSWGPRGSFNSGFQALNLAVLMGAARVLLLGFDMQLGPSGAAHFYPERGQVPSNYPRMIAAFDGVSASLPAGVEVLNCTPGSALTQFKQVDLAEAVA
jgi:hypothetical protein